MADRKRDAYLRLVTGDHQASDEVWHSFKAAPAGGLKTTRYFKAGPPELSLWQAQLHGLEEYPYAFKCAHGYRSARALVEVAATKVTESAGAAGEE